MFTRKFSDKETVEQLHTISLIALVSCVIISYRVWLPIDTYFPSLPVLFPQPNFVLQLLGLFFFIVSLLLITFHKSKAVINIALLYLVVFLIGDYNRIQPWYFYFLVFIGLVNNLPNTKKKLYSIGLILSCVYILSGIQKLNGGFAHTTFPWLLYPVTSHLDTELTEFIISQFWIGPAVEIIAGFGLLFRKTSRYSAIVLIAMHVFILLMIGPLGRNTNVVVWPWNVAFMLFLYAMFIRNKVTLFPHLANRTFTNHSIGVLFFFLILPLLSIWNLWPKHLSAALYSGNKIRSEILIPDEMAELLKDHYEPAYNGQEYVLQPNSWSLKELKVAMYPSQKAHLLLYQQMCNHYSEYADYFVFTLRPITDLKTGERDKNHFFCSDFE